MMFVYLIFNAMLASGLFTWQR